MARVEYGAIVTDLTGSIGGTTFQRNSSGAIARSRAYTPVNPSQQQSDGSLCLFSLLLCGQRSPQLIKVYGMLLQQLTIRLMTGALITNPTATVVSFL